MKKGQADKRIRRLAGLLLFCALLLFGCSAGGPPRPDVSRGISSASFSGQGGEAASSSRPQTDRGAASSEQAGQGEAASSAAPPAPSGGQPKAGGQEAADGLHPYLRELVQEAAGELLRPGMSGYDRALAAFDYMIDHTVFDDPVGLESWRVHGGGEEPIPFLQQRALSPLRFGVGMCEDYAAALTLLLHELGLEAAYVPGLTYSAQGNLVDHAWTAVRIDGTWYHLDSQLEDNVSRGGTVRYRYFLLSDATLAASHRWGQNLIDSGLLAESQNEEIREHYLLPACPRDYPRPEQRTLQAQPAPGKAQMHAQAQAELAAYEAENGPLPPMELNTIPPVFGLSGYGPADEG